MTRQDRAIVFDLDGTLLHYDRPYAAIFESAVESVEGDVPWMDRYHDVFFELLEAMDPEPVRSAFERMDDSADAEALRDRLLEAEIEASGLYDGLHEDLVRLAGAHELAVLTNGESAWQREKLAAYDLPRHFDAIVTSYEAGAHKPDPVAFEAVADRLEATQYAMVGDSESDMGASDLGWATVRYEGQGFGDLPESIEWPQVENRPA